MMDIGQVKRYSVLRRKSKVKKGDFALPPAKHASFAAFCRSLPNILKAKEIREIARAIIVARRKRKAVIFMAGAHVIKCGLSPVVIELLKRKLLTCLVFNGAGIIHDFELALQGKTSEDVASGLQHGKFGMGKETADFLNLAVREGAGKGLGLGESVGCAIAGAKLKYKELSLFNYAHKCKIPACVFVAIGADIIHQHPSFDAAAAGEASLRDFRLLVENIRGLNNGGVVLNFGSAVVLPEVFLKALNLARNLGEPVRNFTAANFDMIYHYRPQQNVVQRPVMGGGKGYYIVGHHEIMLPLLAQAVIEEL
jgi:hypothetical protein